MSEYFIIGMQTGEDITLKIRPEEELSNISNSLFKYNLGTFDPLVLDLEPRDYTLEVLRDKLREIKKRPGITDKQKTVIENIYGELRHKDRYVDTVEITNLLRQKLGPSLPYGEDNDRILFSIANYCLLKDLGDVLSHILKNGKLEQGSEMYNPNKIYELNRIQLVVPKAGKGFVWELVRKIPSRTLEKLLLEYNEMTNIWLDDVINKVRKNYTNFFDRSNLLFPETRHHDEVEETE